MQVGGLNSLQVSASTLHASLHLRLDSHATNISMCWPVATPVCPWAYNMQEVVLGCPWAHPFTAVSDRPLHLLWKLGLWIIWESLPKEATMSTVSCTFSGLSWSGTSGSVGTACWRVFNLGRKRARAGTPRSEPLCLCWLFPKLRRAPWPSEV